MWFLECSFVFTKACGHCVFRLEGRGVFQYSSYWLTRHGNKHLRITAVYCVKIERSLRLGNVATSVLWICKCWPSCVIPLCTIVTDVIWLKRFGHWHRVYTRMNQVGEAGTGLRLICASFSSWRCFVFLLEFKHMIERCVSAVMMSRASFAGLRAIAISASGTRSSVSCLSLLFVLFWLRKVSDSVSRIGIWVC